MTDDATSPKVPVWADRAQLDEPTATHGTANVPDTTGSSGHTSSSDHNSRPATGAASAYPQSDTNGNLEPEFSLRWKSYAQSTKLRWLAAAAILIALALAFAAFRAGANAADRREDERNTRASTSYGWPHHQDVSRLPAAV